MAPAAPHPLECRSRSFDALEGSNRFIRRWLKGGYCPVFGFSTYFATGAGALVLGIIGAYPPPPKPPSLNGPLLKVVGGSNALSAESMISSLV
jgi:hypothetical protein